MPPKIPAAKSSYFRLPNESPCSRMEMVRVADSGKEFTLDRSGKRFIPCTWLEESTTSTSVEFTSWMTPEDCSSSWRYRGTVSFVFG